MEIFYACAGRSDVLPQAKPRAGVAKFPSDDEGIFVTTRKIPCLKYRKNVSENIKKNLKSGLTVSLISIPLSVSLAVASGATPIIGIITAIWAGLVAGIFGGSNFNIVGPTGALSGVVAIYVFLHGIAGLPMLAMLAGVFIITAYLLKLEKYLILIPPSVIHGFTLGVAFIKCRVLLCLPQSVSYSGI